MADTLVITGRSLAVGDANGDGKMDAAIVLAGSVVVLYGSDRGLSERGMHRFPGRCPGLPSTKEPYDHLDHSLSLTDMNGDGRAELAFGMISEAGAAAVCVFAGTGRGITSKGIRTFPISGDDRPDDDGSPDLAMALH